jgi:hypothetical protein
MNLNASEEEKETVTSFNRDKYISVGAENGKTNANESATTKQKGNDKGHYKTISDIEKKRSTKHTAQKKKAKLELTKKTEIYFSDTINASTKQNKTEPRNIKYLSTSTTKRKSKSNVTIKKSQIKDLDKLTNWIHVGKSGLP